MKKLVLLALLLINFNSFSQISNTGIRMSYMGSILYPGFKLGIERPYKIKQIERVFPTFNWKFYRERYLSYNIGCYFHPSFHTNIFVYPEWILRRQSNFGFFYEIAQGIGLSRTFLPSGFEVDDKGEINKIPFAGNFYGLFSFSLSAGINLENLEIAPVKIYWKGGMIAMMPYNSFIYYRPTIEFVVIYCPEKFWKSNPKLKEKKYAFGKKNQ